MCYYDEHMFSGHRSYYGAVLERGDREQLIKTHMHLDQTTHVLSTHQRPMD